MKKLLSNEKYYQSCCEDCEFVFKDQQGALNVVIDVLKDTLEG